MCGGDLAAASTWPELHTVILQHNMIEMLDGSLVRNPSILIACRSALKAGSVAM